MYSGDCHNEMCVVRFEKWWTFHNIGKGGWEGIPSPVPAEYKPSPNQKPSAEPTDSTPNEIQEKLPSLRKRFKKLKTFFDTATNHHTFLKKTAEN